MASSHSTIAAALIALLVAVSAASSAAAAVLRLSLNHRFSDRVRRWAEERALLPLGERWPEVGSEEYYAALARNDHSLHRRRGRSLVDAGSGGGGGLTFFDGNETFQIASLGFLHYAFVELGTPNVTVLVGLDTGSSLFWVPCNCNRCSFNTSKMFERIGINTYSPAASSTSQKVSCNNSLCDLQRECSGAPTGCPYAIKYGDSSSSVGILIEDVMYLRKEDDVQKVVEAPIVFGCGENQSSSFNAAPYGIFGLGMRDISVLNILSSKKITSNTFSMCFGSDGSGRMSFGDKGSIDQKETPLNIDGIQHFYNISITDVQVGNISIYMEFSVIVDSGSSFTYLADPIYTELTESFDSLVNKKRYKVEVLGFDNCYIFSANQTRFLPPTINLTAKGGSKFPFNNPVVFVATQKHQYVCLGVFKSPKLNIIGQNFMTGLRIVFDRERLILGWKNFNCYDSENPESFIVSPPSAAPAPAPVPAAFTPSSYPSEATKAGNHSGQATGALPPSFSSTLKSKKSLLLLLLFFVIL